MNTPGVRAITTIRSSWTWTKVDRSRRLKAGGLRTWWPGSQAARKPGKVDTSVIVEGFDQFSQQINKRTYVLLDNSPLHRSHEFIRHIAQWVKRGLIIQYLP